MSDAHDSPSYMTIFYFLFGLTVAEVALTYTSVPKGLMVFGLVSMAVVKAALVAMYFMHLRFEKSTLAMIAMTPPVLLMMFLTITYPDTAWRLFTHWGNH